MKYLSAFIKLIAIVIGLTSCNPQTTDNIGVFNEAQCPFDLPEGLIQGENFNFGY